MKCMGRYDDHRTGVLDITLYSYIGMDLIAFPDQMSTNRVITSRQKAKLAHEIPKRHALLLVCSLNV